MRKLKLLINTNSIWSSSGYSNQARQLVPLLKQDVDLAISNFFGQEGGNFMLDNVRQYPKIADQWGADAMVGHGGKKGHNADVVMSLQDIWVLNPEALKQIRRWIPVVPIDHEFAPPPVLDRLKYAYRIVTYSKFGYNELKRQGFHSTYIPHTVDTTLLKPEDKAKTRKSINIPPDAYVFGMVAANKDDPPRKSFQQVMDAYVMFKQRHQSTLTKLYMHVVLEMKGGFNIKHYAHHLGIKDDLVFVEPYDMQQNVTYKDMSKVYNSMDVLLNPSSNEGFGVPIIEAQSCGVPAIVNNFTSMPELILEGQTGYMSEVMFKRFTALGSYTGIPSAQSIYEAMEKVYKLDKEKTAKTARKFIKDNYDIKLVYKKYWKPYIKLLEKEVLTS